MKVCVMGLGYIGFPTACLMTCAGHDVLGVDVKESIIAKLREGEIHITNEPGLDELVASAIGSGRLLFSTVPGPADIFVIAVPTPFQTQVPAGNLRAELERPETDYLADLSFVRSAAGAIAPFVQPGNLVVVESTVPPHTTDRYVLDTLAQAGVDTSRVLLAHAPERVLPGNVVFELVHNNRIVGGMTAEAGQAAARFYETFVKGRVVITDATTAELVKLMENTFRDVNIALANEFALVCEHLGVDVWEAIALANLHPRVKFLRPGPGVGGHCIAVDPYFVVEAAPGLTRLVQAARRVNRCMPLHVMALLDQLMAGSKLRRVAILGASYKADVGDERESPALEVAQLLTERGVEAVIHDPYVARYSRPILSVLSEADAVLLLTDHTMYRDINPPDAAAVVSNKLLLDTRGHLDAVSWRAAGFTVVKLGEGKRAEVPAIA